MLESYRDDDAVDAFTETDTAAGDTNETPHNTAPLFGDTIDLQALADEVYDLIKKELRLELQRLGRRR